MKTIHSEKIEKIKKLKRNLEKELNVKIKLDNKEVLIDGDSFDEYIAEKVIDAINFGFPLEAALLIKGEDFLFEVLNIKKYTKRKSLHTIRARIIGKGGKTLKVLHELTRCYFELKDNRVGIIGAPELIENSQTAVISLIRGSKQSNVYAFLEKHQPKPILDLGLKTKE